MKLPHIFDHTELQEYHFLLFLCLIQDPTRFKNTIISSTSLKSKISIIMLLLGTFSFPFGVAGMEAARRAGGPRRAVSADALSSGVSGGRRQQRRLVRLLHGLWRCSSRVSLWEMRPL